MPVPPLPPADLSEVLEATQGLWPEVRGSRFCFTGATGFYGRWMLESLAAADRAFGLRVRVVSLSRDPGRFLAGSPHLQNWAGLEWRRASVAGPSGLPVSRCDFFVHLATEADGAATLADPPAAVEVIAGGTRRALEAAAAGGARRFLFASSGSVYQARAQAEPIGEECPLREKTAAPAGAYDISGPAKRQAEESCAEWSARGMPAIIARGFTFLGPGQPLEGKFAAGNFLADALAGRPVEIKGDGTAVRSYLYAADLAIWLWTLLLRGVPGRPYNVGSEKRVSLQALAEAFSRLGNGRVTVRGRPVPGVRPDYYVPSTRRAREELGLAQRVDLEEGIRRTAAWHRGGISVGR